MFCVSSGGAMRTKAQCADLILWLCSSELWGRVFAAGVALDISASEFGRDCHGAVLGRVMPILLGNSNKYNPLRKDTQHTHQSRQRIFSFIIPIKMDY